MDIWDICKAEPTVDTRTADQIQAWFFMSLISADLPEALEEEAVAMGVPVKFRVWSDLSNEGGHAFLIELIENYRSYHAYVNPFGYEKFYTPEPLGIYNVERPGEDRLSVGAFWTNGCYFFSTTKEDDSTVNIFLAVDEATCELFKYPPSDLDGIS